MEHGALTWPGGIDLAPDAMYQRIRESGTSTLDEHRHSLGREMGVSLDFIVDSVERLVLPINANAAFRLLATVFEADEGAMKNCGEHDWDVVCAGVMAAAAKNLPLTCGVRPRPYASVANVCRRAGQQCLGVHREWACPASLRMRLLLR